MTVDSGYSYNIYMNWDIWVPVGVSLLTLILTVIIVKTSIIWFKCRRSSAHHFIDFTYHFAKLVLHDSLQRQTNPPQLRLYDRKVSPISVILLFTIAPVIFIPAFVSFWASFLLEETFACDPGLDCFLRDPSSFVVTDKQPLSNCSGHYDNDTVICFQFVFDYAAGFATMGGFIAVALAFLKIYGVLLVWLVGIMPSSHPGRRGRCHYCRVLCSIIGVFVFFLTPVILAALILIVVLLNPLFYDILFQSNEGILKFAAYWSSLLYVGPVAGVCILSAIIGSSLSRDSYDVGDTDRDGGLEAGFSASFNMATSYPHQPPPTDTITTDTVTTSNLNLNSAYPTTPAKSQPQPFKEEDLDEPDFRQPQLVGSVLSSYRDVTSLPPQHTESSLLLSAAKSSDYQTT